MKHTKDTKGEGNPDRLGSRGCCEPRKPEQPSLRITRMARMGDGLRSGSRLTPRRQDAKERLKGSTPLGVFVPLCEKFFEIGRFLAENRDFGARNSPKTAFSGGF